MKTSEEWLEEFKSKIREGYETHRMDKRLVGFAHENERRVDRLWKYDEPITAHTMTAGEPMIIAPSPKFRKVTPFQAGIRVNLADLDFNVEYLGWDSYMFGIGNQVAEREYHGIVKDISDHAGNTMKSKDKGKLSKTDIKKAQDWIGKHSGGYADVAIVPLKEKTEWLKNNELWLPHKIPTGYIPEEDRKIYFAGLIDGVKVYWMRFIKDFAVVYVKREISLSNTPLVIICDNLARPKELFVKKWCSSAPILDQAVVKITL